MRTQDIDFMLQKIKKNIEKTYRAEAKIFVSDNSPENRYKIQIKLPCDYGIMYAINEIELLNAPVIYEKQIMEFIKAQFIEDVLYR